MTQSPRESHSGHTIYFKIFGALIALTAVTVAVSYFDFGIFNIFVAMLVATVKASLVALFFMHLIDDNRLNQVIFAGSFVFLALFVGFTASDIFDRPDLKPVTVIGGGTSLGAFDEIEKWRQETPELLAQGSAIYQVHCKSCHGEEGGGDGFAAASLRPAPRNFKSGEWRFGGTPLQVYRTISMGSPGTGMASFSGLSIKERLSLAHFVRSLSPKAPGETAQSISVLKKEIQKSGTGETQKTIPIHWVMELMAVPEETKP